MRILRPDESHFSGLPNFDYSPSFVSVGEPEMAYIDVSSGDETFLCLHGEPTWSFLYRKMIPVLEEEGRVIVPDFVGFGRSDRFDDPDAYTYGKFYTWLETFIDELNLSDITLVCQDWGGLLGLPVAVNNENLFKRIVLMNTGLVDGTQDMPDEWLEFHDFVQDTDDLPIGMLIQEATESELSDEVIKGYEAPFPGVDYKAAAKAWPLLVPTNPEMDGAQIMAETLSSLANWQKPAYVLFSDADPITRNARDPLRELIPTAKNQPDKWIEGAGHFLQEEAGQEIADEILTFVDRT